MPEAVVPLLERRAGEGLRLASLYAGCGGLDFGFQLAGFRCVFANDIDPCAIATHRALLGSDATCGDIDDIGWPDPGSADVVIGGPPCQGFSVIGRQREDDPRSRHVRRFLDVVEHVSPRAFVLENVKQLAVSGRYEPIRLALLERAAQLGFQARIVVLRACDYGVPQRRERMFMIGVRGSEPPVPEPTSRDDPRTVREALAMLPRVGEPGNHTLCVAKIATARRPVLRPSPWKGSLLFNGNGRPLALDAPAPTLPASMGGNATPIIDQRELETGEQSWLVEYHQRLLAGGTVLQRVPDCLRRITVEEAAALQTFPQGMTWFGARNAQFRQIGNAVPPLLGLHVADALGQALTPDSSQVTGPFHTAGSGMR